MASPETPPGRVPGIAPLKRCTLYWAGHDVHWIQALHTANKAEQVARRRFGEILQINGEVIDIDFGDWTEMFRNHDPHRLQVLVKRFGPQAIVNEDYSIMRVGTTWCISIASDTGDPLAPCPDLRGRNRPRTAGWSWLVILS